MEAHRLRAPAHGDGFRSVFVALQPDILGRIAGADDQHVLALEFVGATEVVSVQHPAGEGFDAGEIRHVRHREMSGRHDHPIERLAAQRMVAQSLDRHRELARSLVVGDAAHRRAELDRRPDARLLRPSDDVVVEHLARRERRDRLLEMLVERVVGELQNFLGSVRPQIPIHAAMDRLAVFVQAGAPSVVPQATPIALLLEADDLGNVRSLALRLLECAQLAEAARTGPDHGNTTCHDLTPSLAPICNA